MWAELAVTAAKLLAVAVVLLTCVPIMVWVERRGAAFIQDRLGPNRVGPMGLLQPVIDAVKLFFKEDLTPGGVNPILYTLAPMVSMFVALVTFIVIPFSADAGVEVFGIPLQGIHVAPDLGVGVLYLLALSSLGVYGIVLAGWSSNNKYSLLGGLRSSAQLLSYELSLTLAVLGVILATGSLNLQEVIARQGPEIWKWHAITQPIGFIVFLVAAFAETNRLPFDLAEAETELVAGYHVEYSSMRFASFFMSEYINIVTISALTVTLFLGGWQVPWLTAMVTGWPLVLVSVAAFAAKVAFLLWLFVWVRWSLPRFRYDQVLKFAWKFMFPLALANLIVTVIVVWALRA